jgi:hypothetical protein
MTDGLDRLEAQRDKRARPTRTMPPPRNAPRAAPVDVGLPPRPDRSIQAVDSPTAAPTTTTQLSDLVKASLYLDQDTDEFLEAVRIAGRQTKPKTDASRSAVVRLALNRLAATLSPAEVVEELRHRAPAASGSGRKRL